MKKNRLFRSVFFILLIGGLLLINKNSFSQDYGGDFCNHELKQGTNGNEEAIYKDRCLIVEGYDGSTVGICFKNKNGTGYKENCALMTEVSPGNFEFYQLNTKIVAMTLKFITSSKAVLTHYSYKGDILDRFIWTK